MARFGLPGVVAAAAVLFGLVTIASGGRALFGGPGARAAVGAAVPLVLWFNFVAGFAYVAAGAAWFVRRPAAAALAMVLAIATVAVLLAFGLHVVGGGAYEARTVGAMAIRTTFWVGAAWLWRRAVRAGQASPASSASMPG